MMTDEILIAEIGRLRAEVTAAHARLNTPIVDDWIKGVRNEAAHQQERWGASFDAEKSPLDWFWLIGFLAQKVVVSLSAGDTGKAKHHTISTAAVLLNWHRAISGDDTRMRPGIDPCSPTHRPTHTPEIHT
jgi:hypothetical protein